MRDDEGCQGNPPCQPASAYFSPLSRSIQHPPASSRTKRTPSLHRSPARPAASSLRASHGTFLRSFFSLRVSPCAHYRRPSQTNPLAFLPHPSFFLAFRHLALPLAPFIFGCLSSLRSLSLLLRSFLSLPMNLS